MDKELNSSGIYPCGDRILVRPDEIEEKTDGGIVIPATVADEHMHAQTSGILIAVGPDAWHHFVEKGPQGATIRGYSKPFANVGDKVMFAKYGGQEVWGKDGVRYRVLNDEDITAVIDEGVSFYEFKGRKKGGVSK